MANAVIDTKIEIKQMINDSTLPYSVMALNVKEYLNISNMMETANICGAKEFIIFGTFEHNDDDNFLDEAMFIDFVKKGHYLPIFIEQDKYSRPMTTPFIKGIIQRSSSLKLQPLLIFGNENTGIPKNILDTRMQLGLSYTIELKQLTYIQSFNVTNSCSIICYKIMEAFEEIGIDFTDMISLRKLSV